jgi:hypothetical protein
MFDQNEGNVEAVPSKSFRDLVMVLRFHDYARASKSIIMCKLEYLTNLLLLRYPYMRPLARNRGGEFHSLVEIYCLYAEIELP